MKNWGLGILVLLVSLAVFISPASALEDMNGDGVINVLDLVLMQNPKIVSGDTDANGNVNIFDLATVGLCYGCDFEQDCWSNCEQADVANTVDEIDIFDLATVGLNYNKQFPEPVIDPIFSVSPPHSDLKVGENATIDITIETLPADAEVYAADLKIYFNPAVLKAESATEGDFLKQGGTMTFPIINIDNRNHINPYIQRKGRGPLLYKYRQYNGFRPQSAANHRYNSKQRDCECIHNAMHPGPGLRYRRLYWRSNVLE